MSLAKFARALAKEAKRQEKQALRRQREAVRAYKIAQREQAIAHAEAAVAAYEHHLDALVNLHRVGIDPLDWYTAATWPAPVQPTPNGAHEAAARRALLEFKPGILDRVLGRVNKKRGELEQAVPIAAHRDQHEHAAALAQFQNDYATWSEQTQLAQQMVAQNASLYLQVLEQLDLLGTMAGFGIELRLDGIHPDVLVFTGSVDAEMVPAEALSCTKGGELRIKPLPKSKYWELFQDFVCSAALRLARDTFAMLPVNRVIVNLGERRINPATGHQEPIVYFGLDVSRQALSMINLDRIDPSDSMANFNCRMKFRKTKGFAPVDPVTMADQWVTT